MKPDEIETATPSKISMDAAIAPAPAFSIREVEDPKMSANSAIGIFDSGSGGMVTAAFLSRMLRDAGEEVATVFFGDTANLPYGTKAQQHVAELSDGIIQSLAPFCPIIGIACNTASASWSNYGRVGKSGRPRVFSVVQVAAEQAYARARVVLHPQMKRRRKTIGVLGTELTAEIQSHAEKIVDLHRATLSRAIGHELPLVPYEFGAEGLAPVLSPKVIDYGRTPHIVLIREDEPGPGGTTRAGVKNWDPPEELPHDVEVVARAAQKLVAAVDAAHILNEDGIVKPEWRDRLEVYLKQVSSDLVRRGATALILGCTHFEYFQRDFDRLLPGLAARNGIVSPSGALACVLLDAFEEFRDAHPVRPVTNDTQNYFAFSGTRPPDEMFRALGLEDVVLARQLGGRSVA